MCTNWSRDAQMSKFAQYKINVDVPEQFFNCFIDIYWIYSNLPVITVYNKLVVSIFCYLPVDVSAYACRNGDLIVLSPSCHYLNLVLLRNIGCQRWHCPMEEKNRYLHLAQVRGTVLVLDSLDRFRVTT